MTFAELRHELKKSIKQTYFLIKYGFPYAKFSQLFKPSSYLNYAKGQRNILWIGTFPARHKNVGDHAQTVAVKYFFKDHFGDYQLSRIDRKYAELNVKKIAAFSKKMNSDDLVIIHSSGDFGSQHYDPIGSWHLLRKGFVEMFPNTRVINLPTTVIYDQTQKGRELAALDKEFFNRQNFRLLCRENISFNYAKENLNTDARFLPDFVFYLQRKKKSEYHRKGVLVILRSDSEAKLDKEQRAQLLSLLRERYDKVVDSDILNSKFPVTPMVEDRLVSHIQDVYESYELVVTDRMHGMILSVTTHTPCLALDSGIPHKIFAYKDFLSKAVCFADGRPVSEELIKEAQSMRTEAPELSQYYKDFRKELT